MIRLIRFTLSFLLLGNMFAIHAYDGDFVATLLGVSSVGDFQYEKFSSYEDTIPLDQSFPSIQLREGLESSTTTDYLGCARNLVLMEIGIEYIMRDLKKFDFNQMDQNFRQLQILQDNFLNIISFIEGSVGLNDSGETTRIRLKNIQKVLVDDYDGDITKMFDFSLSYRKGLDLIRSKDLSLLLNRSMVVYGIYLPLLESMTGDNIPSTSDSETLKLHVLKKIDTVLTAESKILSGKNFKNIVSKVLARHL